MTKQEVWISTYSGKKVNPFHMHAEDVDPRDIAHALSMTCRFNGHVKRFYSVAQHCVLMSEMADDLIRDSGWHGQYYKAGQKLPGSWDQRVATACLLHDATEAYVPDVAAPVKPFLEGFKTIEDNIHKAIGRHFKIDCEWFASPEVKWGDRLMVAWEARDLMEFEVELFDGMVLPDEPIKPWTPETAEHLYMRQLAILEGRL